MQHDPRPQTPQTTSRPCQHHLFTAGLNINHQPAPGGLLYDNTMTKKKDATLSRPVAPDKWEIQRQAERITMQDHKTVPHLNSTMGGRYDGKELIYRGRQ